MINPIECLREAMTAAGLEGTIRAMLVGHFSNAWNKRVGCAPPAQAVDKDFTPMEQRGTLVYLGRAGGFDVRDCPEAESLAAFIVAACNAYAARRQHGSAAPAVSCAVRICPDRDRECGDFPRNWCETCPKRPAAPPVADAPCVHCDDTGDVTRVDGIWMGRCTCPAGRYMTECLTCGGGTNNPKGPCNCALMKPLIREVFMAHGFTIKEGQTDLKQYVYDAAFALLAQVRLP